MSYTAHVDTFAYQSLPRSRAVAKADLRVAGAPVSRANQLRHRAARSRARSRLGRAHRHSYPDRVALDAIVNCVRTRTVIARVLVDDLGSSQATACRCAGRTIR